MSKVKPYYLAIWGHNQGMLSEDGRYIWDGMQWNPTSQSSTDNCLMCRDSSIPGVVAPMPPYGRDGVEYVIACQSCARFDSDSAAAMARALHEDKAFRVEKDEQGVRFFLVDKP